MKKENENIEIKFISKYYNQYNIDFLNNVFNKINEERKDILNALEIKECRKVEIFLFDNKNIFLENIQKFYIKGNVPYYCKGTIHKGKIYFLLDNEIKIGTYRYEIELRKVLHEYIHILYNEYIICNNDRIIWLDEGIALNLSKEKGKFFKDRFPILKENIEKLNLNDLDHEKGTFMNENINGYDASYLTVKYLLETKSKKEFNEIIRNSNKARKLRTRDLARSYSIF